MTKVIERYWKYSSVGSLKIHFDWICNIFCYKHFEKSFEKMYFIENVLLCEMAIFENMENFELYVSYKSSWQHWKSWALEAKKVQLVYQDVKGTLWRNCKQITKKGWWKKSFQMAFVRGNWSFLWTCNSVTLSDFNDFDSIPSLTFHYWC